MGKASLEVRKFCFTDSKGIKTSKNKKKNRRRRDQQKNGSPNEANETHKKEENCITSSCHTAEDGNKIRSSLGEESNLPDMEDDIFAHGDIDDEIDPALKEEIDREVEDFARRLNSDWISSLGQERRPVHFSINGNGTARRHANPEH